MATSPPPVDSPVAPTSGKRKETLEELIAACYRPVNADELAWLKSRFRDEANLKERLTALRASGGGADANMDIGFLAAVLEQHVP